MVPLEKSYHVENAPMLLTYFSDLIELSTSSNLCQVAKFDATIVESGALIQEANRWRLFQPQSEKYLSILSRSFESSIVTSPFVLPSSLCNPCSLPSFREKMTHSLDHSTVLFDSCHKRLYPSLILVHINVVPVVVAHIILAHVIAAQPILSSTWLEEYAPPLSFRDSALQF